MWGATYLGLHEQRDAKVDGVAAHHVVDVLGRLAAGERQVKDAANVVLLKHLAKGTLVVGGKLNDLDGDVALALALEQLLDVVAGGVELVAKRREVVDDGRQPLFAHLAAKQQALTGLGHAEVHGGLKRRPVGLDEGLAEAGNLARRRHFDAEEGVGACEARPGKLRHLGGKVVALDGHKVRRGGHVLAGESLCGHLDEVDAEHLGDKGERARRAEVALDDLEKRLTAVGAVGLDNLHVEGTGYLPGLGDLLGDIFDALHDAVVEVGGWQDKRGVARVDASLLDVLRDGVDDELAVGGDTVDVNLLRALDELGDDDGVVRRHVASRLELVLEVLLAADDGHGGAREDVAGAHEHRVANLAGKCLGVLDRRELLPGRLVDADAVENLGKLLTVLGLVDVLGAQSNVLGKLAANGYNDALGSLELVNVHDTLIAEFLEVELVGGVEIGADERSSKGDGSEPSTTRIKNCLLGTYVDHDRLFAHVAESLSGADGTPIKLDGATDTVNTRAENDGTIVIKSDVVRRAVVRGVEIVGIGGEFSGERVDSLDPGSDTEAKTVRADLVLGALDSVGDLTIREAHLLGLEHLLVEEPLVNLGQVVDFVNRVVFVDHGLADGEPAAVSGVLQLKVEVVKLVALEAHEAGIDLADGLLEGLFKGTANGHDLADRLHGAANVALDVLELGEIPARNLGDNVIERRLKVGGGGLGDGVGQFGQGVAETDFGGGGRGAGETGVDLDDAVVEAVGLQGVLDVALADDAEVADNLDGGGAEHVVLFVAQRLAGGDDDGVAGVDSKRVKIFHVADGDTVVVGVADDFVLDLLPAFERLFNEDLRREGEGAGGHVAQLLLVVGEAGAETAEGVGGADNDGVANLVGSVESLVDGADGNGLCNGNIDLLEGLGEEVAIFREL
ncbi:hypothetical protein HC256_000873 [Beauveria bassiana]|nr:hypothetical protein HC256_000873 [Beauveria bassiana]